MTQQSEGNSSAVANHELLIGVASGLAVTVLFAAGQRLGCGSGCPPLLPFALP